MSISVSPNSNITFASAIYVIKRHYHSVRGDDSNRSENARQSLIFSSTILVALHMCVLFLVYVIFVFSFFIVLYFSLKLVVRKPMQAIF